MLWCSAAHLTGFCNLYISHSQPEANVKCRRTQKLWIWCAFEHALPEGLQRARPTRRWKKKIILVCHSILVWLKHETLKSKESPSTSVNANNWCAIATIRLFGYKTSWACFVLAHLVASRPKEMLCIRVTAIWSWQMISHFQSGTVETFAQGVQDSEHSVYPVESWMKYSWGYARRGLRYVKRKNIINRAWVMVQRFFNLEYRLHNSCINR